MTDETTLQGKVALVTGASSGIGRATARSLARDGADVAVAARREERLDELGAEVESEFGRESLVVPTDVTDEREVADMVETTADTFGGIDVLVANAGVLRFGAVEEMPTEKHKQMTDVNIDGTFFTAREAIPHLRASSGNCIFVSSFSGRFPRPFNPLYAATKWWIRGFALSLAGSVGEDDVAVSVVNPAETLTEMGSEDDRPGTERFDPENAAEPSDVADAIAFAARQNPPNAVTELDIQSRDKFSHF